MSSGARALRELLLIGTVRLQLWKWSAEAPAITVNVPGSCQEGMQGGCRDAGGQGSRRAQAFGGEPG